MKFFTLVLLVSLFFTFETANALTVDEIIKLKQGGVSDETIQPLFAATVITDLPEPGRRKMVGSSTQTNLVIIERVWKQTIKTITR
jgi:hypothetical protein